MTNSTTYTLGPSDLPVFRQLLTTQGLIGPSRPPLTGPAVDRSSTNDWAAGSTLLGFMGSLDTLSAAYPTIQNSTLKSWVDLLYKLLTGVETCYGQNFPALYIAYEYYAYSPEFYVWDQYWESFTVGLSLNVDGGTIWIAPWGARPQFPTSWQQTIAGLMSQWGQNPPANVIYASGTQYTIWGLGSSVLSPAHWTDVACVTSGTSALWQSQSSTMTALLRPESLGADVYFFVLHLLIALGTSTPGDQALANRIVTAPSSSQEYPNDTFINQLVYLVLMHLSDPLGSFAWNNAQLQAALTDLRSVIVSTDPASTAVVSSLERHLKVLGVDASYPLQDPYSPSVGFTQRQADTLYALDTARAVLRSGQTAAMHGPTANDGAKGASRP